MAHWHPDTPEFRGMVMDEERLLEALEAASAGPTQSLDEVVAELGIVEDDVASHSTSHCASLFGRPCPGDCCCACHRD